MSGELATQIRLLLSHSQFTFPELDRLIEKGHSIDDIVMRLPRNEFDDFPSRGKFRTKYGYLKYRISVKPMGLEVSSQGTSESPHQSSDDQSV